MALLRRGGGVTFTVFLIFFVDNVLLSIIVPIIPDYLEDKVELREGNLTAARVQRLETNIGALFASKSFAQILLNPIVGKLTTKMAPNLMILMGSGVFIISSLVFAIGTSYWSLFFARSIHGFGSAISIVSGLALLAESHHNDRERSRAMGLALGGMAVGVLVGYPLGGFMYDRYGKTAPFLTVAAISLLTTFLEMGLLSQKFKPTNIPGEAGGILQEKESQRQDYGAIDCLYEVPKQPLSSWTLLKDVQILMGVGSIGLSTLSIATLEPCLPVWLRGTINPKEWQIGTAFVPDSFGYLIGTNLFGVAALELGRWTCATVSHLMITLCTFSVPMATQMSHLIIPHFGIGLGIAIIDASIMPLLACLAERRCSSEAYGLVYAMSQTTVCLAYGLGPLVGGWLMGIIGFQWVMRSISLLNFGMVILHIGLRFMGLVKNE